MTDLDARYLAGLESVKHADNCESHLSLAASHPHFAGYFGRCTCDRPQRQAALVRRAVEAGMRKVLELNGRGFNAADDDATQGFEAALSALTEGGRT